MADGEGDRPVDDALLALIRREPPSGKFLDVLELLSDVPLLANIVKPALIAGGWWLDDRKPDRVFDVLVALKTRIHEAERKQEEYVRREEFKDLLEETLRRIADEPSNERREWLKNILLKVIDEPRDPADSKRFLRLVEELSTNAHQILAILDEPITGPERQLDRDTILAGKSTVPKDRVGESLEELARDGLVDRDRFDKPVAERKPPSLNTVGGLVMEDLQMQGRVSYDSFFTRLGRDFIAYRRGTVPKPG